MTKKHEISLRAAADAAVATWRESDAKAKEARKAANAIRGATIMDRKYTTEHYQAAHLDVTALEHESIAERDRLAAVIALNAAEAAELDELALARDPKKLHADVAALDAEEAALYEQLRNVQQRRGERVTKAFQADIAHANRRSGAGFPPSTALPRAALPNRTYLDTLATFSASGEKARDFAAVLENARSLETRIAAQLEETRLAEKEEADRIAARKADREWREQQQRNEVHARERQWEEDQKKEQARKEKLAADFRARRAP